MPGPLEGIKILELIRVPPGAFCTMMLADMGAEVMMGGRIGETIEKSDVLLFNLSTVISRVFQLI